MSRLESVFFIFLDLLLIVHSIPNLKVFVHSLDSMDAGFSETEHVVHWSTRSLRSK